MAKIKSGGKKYDDFIKDLTKYDDKKANCYEPQFLNYNISDYCKELKKIPIDVYIRVADKDFKNFEKLG